MPAGRPKSIDSSKVFDVARPGNSKPLGTSRPVITNSDAGVKDQMVDVPTAPSVSRKIITPITVDTSSQNDSTQEVEITPAETASSVVHELKLEPITDMAIDEEAVSEEAEDTLATEDKAEQPPQPETITDQADSPGASESAAVEAVADTGGNNRQEQRAADEQAKLDAALQELIDSKKYVVPLAHDSSGRRGNGMAAAVFLIVLLLVVAAYLIIDAKVLKVGLNLPYHFFKQ